MYPESIKKLTESFLKLPTVGHRTATRFALYLVKAPKEEVKEIIESISLARKSIKRCSFCFDIFESSSETETLCSICSDQRRNKKIVCIIEKEQDLEVMKTIKEYNGIFFILGENPEKRTKELINKVKEESIKEIIVATNFTLKGEKLALYLERNFKNSDVKISRIARGIPKGGEIEYIDEETICSAFKNRTPS
jgi:recombination protein RecR